MVFWVIIGTVILGLIVFCQAVKHSWEQWYYGRARHSSDGAVSGKCKASKIRGKARALSQLAGSALLPCTTSEGT